jgi:hypothetical protein
MDRSTGVKLAAHLENSTGLLVPSGQAASFTWRCCHSPTALPHIVRRPPIQMAPSNHGLTRPTRWHFLPTLGDGGRRRHPPPSSVRKSPYLHPPNPFSPPLRANTLMPLKIMRGGHLWNPSQRTEYPVLLARACCPYLYLPMSKTRVEIACQMAWIVPWQSISGCLVVVWDSAYCFSLRGPMQQSTIMTTATSQPLSD